jgi:hypothetical protein
MVLGIRPNASSTRSWQWMYGYTLGNITIVQAGDMFIVPSINVDELATNYTRLLGLLYFRATLLPQE